MEDVAAAFDTILHRGVVGQTYNIGSPCERSVLSVAHDVLRLFQQPPERILFVRDRAFNDRRYFVCDRKLAALGAPAAPRQHHSPPAAPAAAQPAPDVRVEMSCLGGVPLLIGQDSAAPSCGNGRLCPLKRRSLLLCDTIAGSGGLRPGHLPRPLGHCSC